jgi:hypothetical protein
MGDSATYPVIPDVAKGNDALMVNMTAAQIVLRDA